MYPHYTRRSHNMNYGTIIGIFFIVRMTKLWFVHCDRSSPKKFALNVVVRFPHLVTSYPTNTIARWLPKLFPYISFPPVPCRRMGSPS